MFQSVNYIIYMFQCFETPEYGGWNFHLFMFQHVSKRFETIKILDLDIFSLFQSVYYIIYMFQCFETPEYGVWNFHLFMFQIVSKRFEKIETVDLDILSLFQYVSVSLLYNLYVSMFRNTRYGAWNFHLFCFSLFRNVSKQLKVWT